MAMQSWQTEGQSAGARWQAWRDVLNQTHLPWSVDPRTAERDFAAGLAWRESRDLSLIACHCQPCAGHRQAAEIRATDQPSLGLLLILEGREAVRQGEVSVLLQPGDLFLWDSDRPLDFEIRAPLRKITLLIGKGEAAALLQRSRAPLHLPRDQPEAQLLAGYLMGLSRTMAQQEATAWAASQRSALDLLATAIAAKPRQEATSRRHLLRLAVERDIEELARDPDLSPSLLAERRGVSARYLHMLFAAEQESVGARIRATRLEGARRDLLSHPTRDVTEIAFAWGFNSPAHFSRSFKERFGSSPSALRVRGKLQ